MLDLERAAPADDRRASLTSALPSLARAGLALFFVAIEYSKLSSDPCGEWVRIFERIGLGQWLRYLAAAMQVAGGVLFLFRRTLSLGAAMLACTMAGAVAVDLWLMPPFFFIPLMLLFAIAATWMLDR